MMGGDGSFLMHWTSQLCYRDPATETYLGSPTLTTLDDGTLVAAHDYFGPGAPSNDKGVWNLTTVYCSTNRGRTWSPITHVSDAFWSTIFERDDRLYLLGTNAEYGDIVIHESRDGGYTWTEPTDAGSGLLFEGGSGHTPPNYHCAPTPVVESGGRLYRAFEDQDPPEWPDGFRSLVISCETDMDLLDADNWTMSEELPMNPDDVPESWGVDEDNEQIDYMADLCGGMGWLEGNVVETPNGELMNVLRVNSKPVIDKGAIVSIQDNGQSLSFERDDFIDFPGGMNKFTVRRDPETDLYWALVNPNTVPSYPDQRNVLALSVSESLREWELVRTVNSSQDPQDKYDLENVGFQYVDWIFDGGDILFLSRTSADGARNFHDSNRITFDIIPSFRELTPERFDD